MYIDGNLWRRAKEKRKEFGLKQSEVAAKVKTTQGMIQKIEANETVHPKCINELADIYRTTPQWLMGGIGFAKVDQDISSSKIPILNWEEAINWCEPETNNITSEDKEFIYNPLRVRRKDFFALKVSSPSMSDMFPVGSILILAPSFDDPVTDGEFFLFYDQDEKTSFLRQVVKDSKVYLRPLNIQFDLEPLTKRIKNIARIIGSLNLLSHINNV